MVNSSHLDIITVGYLRSSVTERPTEESRVTVTKLTKHLPESVLRAAMSHITVKVISPAVANIKFKAKVKTGEFFYINVFVFIIKDFKQNIII